MKSNHFLSEVSGVPPIIDSLKAISAPPPVRANENVVRSRSLLDSRLCARWAHSGIWLLLFALLFTAQPSFCDTQYISSLNARVTGLRFFEGDVKGPPYGQREYSTVFSKSSARYIYWEMTLAFPKANRKSSFTIVSKYYNPHGNFMTRLTSQGLIEPGWTWYRKYHGYGWKRPGNWETGTYRVDIFVDNQRVTSGNFTITYGGLPLKKSSPALNEADTHFNKGVEYSDEGKLDEAIAEFTKAIALNPQDRDAYYNRGIIFHDLGQYEKAIADYSEAIKLDPRDLDAYFDRGVAYSEKGQSDKARR